MMDQQQPNAAPLVLNETDVQKRRTSGQKILMFFFIVTLVVMVFTLMAINVENVSTKQKESTKQENRPAGFADSRVLEDELFAAASRNTPLVTPSTPDIPDVPSPPKTQIIMIRPMSINAPAKQQVRPVITESEKDWAKRYRDMKNSAILSKSNVDGFVKERAEQEKQQTGASSFILPNNPPQYEVPPETMQALMQGVQKDVNGQTQKLDFLLKEAVSRTPQGYSENTRMPQIAQLELKAGTVIPGLLLTGLNSDLPGTVIGQVSENVYDTASGHYLLIPQGARILGVYDSRITYGQKRVGIIWNRLIYPDGSTLNIAGSPGTDLAGYSGIKGTVDNHYGQLLSAAFFTSIFASAADIATGGRDSSNNSDSDKKSVRDIIVETLGAEVAELGAKMADRALDIQPTIKIRPGQRFNVMVQEDVVFLQPWNSGNKR
jgi:type IV secretion system protein VirB10